MKKLSGMMGEMSNKIHDLYNQVLLKNGFDYTKFSEHEIHDRVKMVTSLNDETNIFLDGKLIICCSGVKMVSTGNGIKAEILYKTY